MAWMADTYANFAVPSQKINAAPGVVTGKPLEFGAPLVREKATAQGLMYVMDELLPELGIQRTLTI